MALVCLWSGCQGDAPTDTAPVDPCAGSAPTLALGTGEFAFEPLLDGDRIMLTNGPQGGWHLWTSGRLTGVNPVLSVMGTVEDLTTGTLLAGGDDLPVTLDLSEAGVGTYAAGTCAGEFYGQLTYLNDAVPAQDDSYLDLICSLEDHELEFSLSVTEEATGETVSEAVRVLARLDPANVPYCREN
jgi:hypothetical protein